MTSLNLTARVLAKFPARVLAGIGMIVSKANGVWTIAFNSAGLASQPVTDPANTDIIVEMPDGSLAKVPLSAALTAASYVEETGKKNALLNGGMEVWQRTTSDAAVTTTRKLVADRWAVKTAAGTLTSVARGTAPATNRSPFLATLTGNAGVTTVDIDQRIEAANVFPLVGPMTFSALITNNSGSAFTPTLFVECPTVADNWAASNVRNNAGAGDALQSCANGAATRVTWSADISGYVDVTKGLAFRLRFPSGALDVNTKSISITEVQAEPRPTNDGVRTLFEVETFSDELARCQRYYYKSFPYATVPVTNAGVTGALSGVQVVAATTFQGSLIVTRFPAVMRATPTITLFNTRAANAQIGNDNIAVDCSGSLAINTGDGGVSIQATTGGGSAAGNRHSVHITADAEL